MFELPFYIQEILAVLGKNGFQAYAVGGCVRDLLRGVTPNDYDITTDALPETVATLFPRTVPTGIRHGTVTVLCDDVPVEVTTFRQEYGYSDRRRPDRVDFVTDVKEDLARRDFTVNAMAYHPEVGIVDPFGGQKDLQNGVLRAVGNAPLRFREDALRILRLFRFAATLGFSPEPKTLSAALESSPLLQNISRERIAVELAKTVCGQNPAALTSLLQCGGLNFLSLCYQEPLSPLAELPNKLDLRLFGFLISCGGTPDTLRELRYSNHIISACERFFAVYQTPITDSVGIKKTLRDYGEDTLLNSWDYRKVFYGENYENAEKTLADILENREPYQICHLAVNGRQLKKLGFDGAEIGVILQKLCDEVIRDPNQNTTENLLQLSSEMQGTK